jgi:hypothetical protein
VSRGWVHWQKPGGDAKLQGLIDGIAFGCLNKRALDGLSFPTTDCGRYQMSRMQASETKLRQLIEGTKQYVVPLFQRPYSWSEKQWKTLWTDVVEQSRHDDGRPHFFGSIVTTPEKSVPQGVGKYLLIDGQQRITTVQVFLAALRDTAVRSGDAKLQDRIDGQYLKNAYEEDDERLKVLPTQDDRAAFRAIVWKSEIPEGSLRACYQFFISRLQQLSSEQLEAIHLAVVDRLSLVSITCDEHDNPHLIF